MKPGLGRAIAGGVVGTALISMMMYWVAPVMMGMPMDVAAMVSGMLGTSWAVGMGIHWVLGSLVFPIAYATVVYGALTGAPWLRGALFGVTLWLLSEVLVTPMAGGGVFHAGDMMAIMGGLVGHLIYGVALGAIARGGASALPQDGTSASLEGSMSMAHGVDTLQRGVRDRSLDVRREGFKEVVQGMAVVGGAGSGSEAFPPSSVLMVILAFALETDRELKRQMGFIILATGLLKQLADFPDYERRIGSLLKSKAPPDFEDDDFQALANGVRRLTGMTEVARRFFGDDVFEKVAAEPPRPT